MCNVVFANFSKQEQNIYCFQTFLNIELFFKDLTNWVDNKCLVPIGSSLGQSLKRSPPAAVESTTVAPSTETHTDKQWTEEMLSNLVDCGRTVEQIQQLSHVLTYPSLVSLIWVCPICLKIITIKCYSCFIRPEFDFQQACVEPSLRVKGDQG